MQLQNQYNRDWLYERTGQKVEGKVDWTNVLLQEIQVLSEKMFDAADVFYLQEMTIIENLIATFMN